MQPTDISVPDYFHKVVDCQWACPAHTPVPEYIRMIADRRYTDAYMVNWYSNIFPGILGRTCDRPCEPACRRGRVEEDEQPVAICRLKRVAADNKGDITPYLPAIPREKNGKRIALVGAGPASLTVARDLLPLGYHCVMFDGDAKGGGMMRTQIPRFRLPERVTDEEVDLILDMGVETRFGEPVRSLKALLAEDWDAVFVGCGAPRGRDLDIPGRHEAAANIHIGIDWLSSVSFGHVDRIGRRVIVLGGGNTAMDCCRSSRRLGGEEVTVVVRSGFDEMKASPWEKEDATHEGIPILNWLVPKEFTHEGGRLTGVLFEKVKAEYDDARPPQPGPDRRARHPYRVRRRAGRGRPGERLSVDRARHRHRIRPLGHAQGRPEDDAIDLAARVLRRRRRLWAEEHHLGRCPRPRRRDLDRQALPRRGCRDRPPPGVTLVSQKMGIHEWSYDNDISNDLRYRVPLRDTAVALADIRVEVELGYDEKLGYLEAERCLNCDVQTVFTGQLCIECDACVDICPMDCITFTDNGPEDELRGRLMAPGVEPRAGPLYRRPAEDRADHGQGRGCLPALRAVRRALPDRRLGHAQIPARDDPGRPGMPRPLAVTPRWRHSGTARRDGSGTHAHRASRASDKPVSMGFRARGHTRAPE